MATRSRLDKEVARAVQALGYIRRAEAAGQDVSRLAEKREKSIASLVRHRRCFTCGRAIENPESLKAWEVDHQGPECRRQIAVAS